MLWTAIIFFKKKHALAALAEGADWLLLPGFGVTFNKMPPVSW
jgi:hypothetical protein